jgi:hypothetical protein
MDNHFHLLLELGIKAGGKELKASWERLRRGWYVGGEGFRLGLLARAKEVLAGKRSESHGGEARRAHDQAQAGRMLEWGLRRFGLSQQELVSTPKGQLEKQVLAWWLHGQTTARRRWIAQELAMGYESRVSQAMSCVEASRTEKVVEMKRKLQAYQA